MLMRPALMRLAGSSVILLQDIVHRAISATASDSRVVLRPQD
jgi:hypothetical protein